MSTAMALLGLLQASLRIRQRLVVENLALRHQVAVLKRSVKRARIEDWRLQARGLTVGHYGLLNFLVAFG